MHIFFNYLKEILTVLSNGHASVLKDGTAQTHNAMMILLFQAENKRRYFNTQDIPAREWARLMWLIC